ncbi:class I SAM-dependent methyltransferase [Paraferrimonas haliotis]|uniref:Ribosomal RNA small subunit methyltransferase C n=1 Tax=Paraferrimonas haliotis TaxID=2013866 RepID=A0AA37TML9_9GAMM|nr:class I SAM-dependent methyltransferase [Paraferrimonas haliotis]GLS83098.1 ribosomal RNA small subunit methyltransferase C [Paraferrimonas haliotis]
MLCPTSLVLERNFDEFDSVNTLLINHESDSLASLFSQQVAACHALSLDYQHFTTLKQQASERLQCHFGVNLPKEAPQQYEQVILYYPKAKPLARYLFALAQSHLTENGILWVVGENKSGVKTLAKQLPDGFSAPIKQDNARHCLLFSSVCHTPTPMPPLQQWLSHYPIEVDGETLQISMLPGVFSDKRLDKGSELFLKHMPELKGRVLDFGCGCGVIGLVAAKRYPDIKLECIDINAMALASTELTLASNQVNAKVYPSDGLQEVEYGLKAILSNPPFHDGLQTSTSVAMEFIRQSKKKLKRRSVWQIVANGHLPYSDAIATHFGPVNIIDNDGRFKIYRQSIG